MGRVSSTLLEKKPSGISSDGKQIMVLFANFSFSLFFPFNTHRARTIGSVVQNPCENRLVRVETTRSTDSYEYAGHHFSTATRSVFFANQNKSYESNYIEHYLKDLGNISNMVTWGNKVFSNLGQYPLNQCWNLHQLMFEFSVSAMNSLPEIMASQVPMSAHFALRTILLQTLCLRNLHWMINNLLHPLVKRPAF